MTNKELRELPVEELASEIEKAREKAWKMRFQARGEPLEKPADLRLLRRDIARMLTVLNERRAAASARRHRSGLSRTKRRERARRDASGVTPTVEGADRSQAQASVPSEGTA